VPVPSLGAHVPGWFERQDWLADHDVLDFSYEQAPGLRLTQEALFADDDWAVDRQVLVQTDGLKWSEEVDPVALALVSGADGTTRSPSLWPSNGRFELRRSNRVHQLWSDSGPKN